MPTATAHWTEKLAALGACADAVEWARDYDSLDTAWAKCKRGDWMMWLAGRVVGRIGSDSRRTLVLAACDCAELALPLFELEYPGEHRPRKAIAIARAWARGEAGVTLAQVRDAADNAAYAAYAAANAGANTNAYAAYAVYVAANAGDNTVANAVFYEGNAAVNTAAYTAAAHGSADRARVLAACAGIVRRHYPAPPAI